MYNTSAAFNISDINSRANAYLANEILDATPEKLLIKIYDFAIAHCKSKNLEKTNKALMTLITGLRFDDEGSAEIAIGLKKLYEFCQDQMRQKNYDIVEKILTELRATWISAFKS